MTVYQLPDLPYDEGVLEPHLSARILELHHGTHHRAYVDGANATLDELAAAIDEHFGSFAACKAHMTQATTTVRTRSSRSDPGRLQPLLSSTLSANLAVLLRFAASVGRGAGEGGRG